METSISLIISTYNWESALQQILESVKRQVLLPVEVIIADDGSGQATAEIIRTYQQEFPVPLYHVWQPDEGFQKCRILNKALAKVTGNYVVQIDGDILLHPQFILDHAQMARKGYFTNGSRVLLSPQVSTQLLGAVSGRLPELAIARNRMNGWRCSWLRNLLAGLYQSSAKHIIIVRGCNMGFWKQDLYAINGYDEDFVGWGREDSDLAVRLYNNGVRKRAIKFGAIAYHLYHQEADRNSFSANDERLRQHIEQKTIRCSKGLDQYL